MVQSLLQALVPADYVVSGRYRIARASGPSVSFEDGFALVRLEGRASLVGREQDVFADVTVYGDLDVERTQQQRGRPADPHPPAGGGRASRRGGGRVAARRSSWSRSWAGRASRSSRPWLRRSRSRCGASYALRGSGCRAGRARAHRRRRDPRSADRGRRDRVRRPSLGLDGRGGGPGGGRARDAEAAGRSFRDAPAGAHGADASRAARARGEPCSGAIP